MATTTRDRTHQRPEPRLSDFNDQPRWVAWQEEWITLADGREKLTKIPYDPHSGHKARVPTDPSTWGTRAQAEDRWERMKRRITDGRRGGVGIVLGELEDGRLLMGLDLDSCRGARVILPWADEIIDKFGTYTEFSPSRQGVKVYFLVGPADAAAVQELMGNQTRKSFSVGEHQEVAIDRARYYAVTDKPVQRVPETLTTVSLDVIQWFMTQAGPTYQREHGKGGEAGDDAGSHARDESGSGYGFRFLWARKRAGDTYEQARDALLADDGPAGEWACRKWDENVQAGRDGDAHILRDWNKIEAQSKAQATPAKTWKLVNAADVVMQEHRWIWKDHLARGVLEILSGLMGMGKSQIQHSIGASITTGRAFPGGARGIEPAGVLMVAMEDHVARTWAPRLEAAGADRSRVELLHRVKVDGKLRPFLIAEDMDIIEDIINEHPEIICLMIDPVTAHLGSTDSNSVTAVRQHLYMLQEFAERRDIAVSVVTHPSKGATGRALDHYIGSQAFIAGPRIGHLCLPEMKTGADGRQHPTGRMLLTRPKGSIIPPSRTSLAYRIESTIAVGHTRGEQVNTSRVVWEDEVAITADEAIQAEKDPKVTLRVDSFLRQLLETGPKLAQDVMKEAARHGYSENQVRDAAKRLGLQNGNGMRKAGLEHWEWYLPD
jgi:RecA-family ATPase